MCSSGPTKGLPDDIWWMCSPGQSRSLPDNRFQFPRKYLKEMSILRNQHYHFFRMIPAQWILKSAWTYAQSDDQSLLSTWKTLSPFIQNVPSEDSNQTVQMHRLIWIFSGHTCLKEWFLMLGLIYCCCCCVEVLQPSQPNGVMSSAVSLPNHKFTGQA